MREIFHDNSLMPRPPGSLGLIGLLDISLLTFFNHHNAKFYIEELRFFDLYFDNKSITIYVYIEHISRNTYFQNIYMSVQQAKDEIPAKKSS